jgi:hypothetical protein
MRVVSRQSLRRWAVVVAGTAVLCALPAVVAAWPVPASALTAAQLRARISASGRVPFQGYAESDVNLGLPSLPDLGNVISLLDGTTDQYVWYRSPGQWRADVLNPAGEEDTYQTTTGSYLWDYNRNLLTQVTGSQPVRLPRAADLLPPSLARRLLSFAGPADHVARIASQRVAGIDAAGLRITPGSPDTTIGAIDIWADPADGLAVQVEVFGRGSGGPVLVTRFLGLSLTTPAAATLAPNPGPGVGLSQTALPDAAGVLNGFGPPLPASLGGFARVANPTVLQDVAAYGPGLARFAVIPLPERTGAAALTAAASAGATIQVHGSTAAVVETPLLTVLLVRAQYGPVYLLTGAVTPTALENAAADLVDLP